MSHRFAFQYSEAQLISLKEMVIFIIKILKPKDIERAYFRDVLVSGQEMDGSVSFPQSHDSRLDKVQCESNLESFLQDLVGLCVCRFFVVFLVTVKSDKLI